MVDCRLSIEKALSRIGRLSIGDRKSTICIADCRLKKCCGELSACQSSIVNRQSLIDNPTPPPGPEVYLCVWPQPCIQPYPTSNPPHQWSGSWWAPRPGGCKRGRQGRAAARCRIGRKRRLSPGES